MVWLVPFHLFSKYIFWTCIIQKVLIFKMPKGLGCHVDERLIWRISASSELSMSLSSMSIAWTLFSLLTCLEQCFCAQRRTQHQNYTDVVGQTIGRCAKVYDLIQRSLGELLRPGDQSSMWTYGRRGTYANVHKLEYTPMPPAHQLSTCVQWGWELGYEGDRLLLAIKDLWQHCAPGYSRSISRHVGWRCRIEVS